MIPIDVIMLATSLLLAETPSSRPSLGVSCIWTELSPQERQTALANMGVDRRIPDDLARRLDEVSDACARRLSLTPDEIEEAEYGLISTFYLERYRAELAHAGIPADALDTWFDAQADDIRANLATTADDAQAVAIGRSLMTALQPRGISSDQFVRQAELIMSYLISKSFEYRLQHGLSLRDQMVRSGSASATR